MAGAALPIRRHRRALVEAVSERPFLIVTGETGSGKSTQLPKYLFEAGNGRGAARSLRAARGPGMWETAQLNVDNPPVPTAAGCTGPEVGGGGPIKSFNLTSYDGTCIMKVLSVYTLTEQHNSVSPFSPSLP